LKLNKLGMLVVAVSLIVGVIGCSSGNKGSQSSSPAVTNSPSSAQPSESASTPAVPAKKITISAITGTWSSPIPDPNGEGVKMMNEKFNIDFKPQGVPYDEYESKLPVVMAAGDLPDIIGMENVDANFVKWARQGAFLPLNDYIGQYEAFKNIPQNVWDAVTVDGKIYAIPEYFPSKYGKKPIIRKDWLDNLGLSMPTNFEELKKVAIAFTKDDPDRNGKDDTLGLGLAKQIVYGLPMGAGYDNTWYYKDAQGQMLPGNLSEGFKQQISVLHDLYAAGAISKDWALTKTADARKDFFTGKAGIFFEQPYDISQSRFKGLKEANPGAELAVIPPFVQEDGQQGFLSLPGYYQVLSLNAGMKNDPDKINRILEIFNYFMTFIPPDQRTPDNPDFDWQRGGIGKGYEMEDNTAIDIEGAASMQPYMYLSIPYWAPADEDTDPAGAVQEPFTKAFVQSTVDMLKTTKFYLDPTNRIHSDVYYAKASELNKAVTDYQTRMIVGNSPLSDWDKMVDEYMKKGGKEVIDDVNKQLQASGISGEWK